MDVRASITVEMARETVSLLERRRIEAKIVKPIYEVLKRELGEDAAKRIIRDAVRASAIEAGRGLAERHGPNRNLETFAHLIPLWSEGGALEIDTIRRDENALDFDVCRCRYAEMYREIGAEELGPLLSCNRDGSLAEGYDPEIELTRTHTIMEGAERCDFRFRLRRERS